MLSSVVWFVFLVFCALCFYDTIKPSNFPPGPIWLPLIGCYPKFVWLRRKHGYMHLAFQNLAAKYGPLFGLKLGNQRIVVVNDHELVRRVLLQEEFNGRPDTFFFRLRAFGKRKGVLFTDGPTWQQHRRFSMKHLRSFGFGQSTMETHLMTEAQNLVAFLHQQSEKGPIPMHSAFSVAVINSLWTTFAGHRFEYNDKKLEGILQYANDAFRLIDTAGGILSQLPFLRFIVPELSGFNKLMEILENLWAFLDEEINDHQAQISDEPRDLIDAFLIEISRNESPNSIFNREDLLVLCLDIFLAGSETTSNTLATAFMHLALNPQWIGTLQQELLEVVGRNRPPSLADKPALPKVESFLAEVQRSLVVAPLGVPHKTMKDVSLGGYTIPKDTVVMLNLYSVHHDKNHWGDPEVLRPQRFLDGNGRFIQDEASIPFGLGKRRCLGEVLARSTMFLFFSHLIHHFNFELSEEHAPPDPRGFDGFTIAPKPYYLKLTPRTD